MDEVQTRSNPEPYTPSSEPFRVYWWHNHILRMDSSRLAKNAKNFQPDGQRNVGRPRRQWEGIH
jgi:hypothetical protein